MAKSRWPRWFKVFGVAYIFSMVLTAGTFWAVGIAVTTLIAYSAIIALGLARHRHQMDIQRALGLGPLIPD